MYISYTPPIGPSQSTCAWNKLVEPDAILSLLLLSGIICTSANTGIGSTF